MKKRKLIILILIALLIVSITTIYTMISIKNVAEVSQTTRKDAMTETSTDIPYIEIMEDMSHFLEDKTIDITLTYKNLTNKISYGDVYIEYDREIFQEITSSDISYDFDEDTLDFFNYNKSKGKIVVQFTEDIEVTTLCKIKLKVLDTVTTTKQTYLNASNGYIYSYDTDIEMDLENASKTLTVPIRSDESGEGLYLSTTIYKIGNDDIYNYEVGERYISRVQKETTKTEFINNLITNGTIRVLKQNGEELGEDELVGTGMTLEVTKDEEIIELKIAVMGDIDGNGEVTATDLSTVNQTILEILTLQDEYKIAADLDENDEITATDLSTINQMILGIL